MGLFRKKTTEPTKKTKPVEEDVSSHVPQRRIITAEGWHRKILGKPTEVVLKKRG